jgi:hypothetical protein
LLLLLLLLLLRLGGRLLLLLLLLLYLLLLHLLKPLLLQGHGLPPLCDRAILRERTAVLVRRVLALRNGVLRGSVLAAVLPRWGWRRLQ